ncbi:uncharacterized protein Z518_04593 [Rhinocladiella mackenziei CBS 650.93]|uniref:Uncharacterized protein n=1 Tax=Rhinocladiella mackenziei CBS 650.93 TaxID=1442369 RepID=A0A0D2FWL4_9EURO|nr:uncharacterized protein Z518_04593 [Rhinocladiella mackenziei CBS 650.93]KIX06617.1 hypothetical protein Z518_04593 [Rhinocladiella mackenziei CBS 650.93]
MVLFNGRGKVAAWCLLVFDGAFLILGIVCAVLDILFFESGLFAVPALLLLCVPAALGLWLGLHSLWHSQSALRSLPLSVQRRLLDDDGNTGLYTDSEDNSPEDVHQEDTCLLADDGDGPLAQAFRASVQHDALVSSNHPASSPTNLPDITTAGPSSQGNIQSNAPPQRNLSEDAKRKSVIDGTTDRGATDQNMTSSSLPTHDADSVQLVSRTRRHQLMINV